jgi:hypothetical protein
MMAGGSCSMLFLLNNVRTVVMFLIGNLKYVHVPEYVFDQCLCVINIPKYASEQLEPVVHVSN